MLKHARYIFLNIVQYVLLITLPYYINLSGKSCLKNIAILFFSMGRILCVVFL